MSTLSTTVSLVFAFTLGYTALRFWRRGKASDPADRHASFRPRIGFTRLDGMESLSLLLANGTRRDVWAEEIEIFLSDLSAEEQTAAATCHEIHKIRQMVTPGDMLPISLCGAIYRAAGDPQRKYSCVMTSVLRYHIGQERFTKKMETYRVRMLGLTASGIQRERKAIPIFPSLENPKDIPAAVPKLK